MGETFKTNIENHFKVVDDTLAEISDSELIYWFLFSIRTEYAVVDELNLHKSKVSFFFSLQNLIKILTLIALYPFTTVKIINCSSISILGNWRFDDALSKELNISQLKITKAYRFFSLEKLQQLFLALAVIFKLLLCSKLAIFKTLRCVPSLLNFYQYYNDADLSGINVLITEDDLNATQVAILLKAKQNNITRVKIEYVQIDYLQHNNVFADYYFYPTNYHKKIRQSCPYNSQLKYIEGGYLNTSFLQHLNSQASQTEKQIIYFTIHSDLFSHDDCFYITEVLALMPDDYKLNVKIHPYDSEDKYKKFEGDSRVTFYRFGQIDNIELIRNATICLSMFSAMSLEAKQLCNQSFFINYLYKESIFSKDYDELNIFFDTISSNEMLKEVLNGTFDPKPLELFRANVNMTYPDTFEVFKKLVERLNTNNNDVK